MPPQDHQAVLSALDRAALEQVRWLAQVHEALLFKDGQPPPPPDLPRLLCDWASVPEVSLAIARERSCELAALLKARRAMVRQAARVTGARAPTAEGYRRFMAAVADYGLALRTVETLLRQALAETDPLTGVSNRLAMMRDLEREAQRAARTGAPCCLAILDLDHFKAVNDTYGHQAGDRVLEQAARVLVRGLRPYDRIYRYGGEEFLFCLPDTDPDAAESVLNRLARVLARTAMRLGDGRSIRITASIGLAELMPGVDTLAAAIAHADAALYAAKAAGRNRVCAEDCRAAQPLSAARETGRPSRPPAPAGPG